MHTYTGSCHCGDVEWEAKADITEVMSCNCSICKRKGTLLTFVTPDAFNLKKGTHALTDYQFNKKHIHHLFCKTCGVQSFARGADALGNEMIALNVRCIPEIDIDSLTVTHFNGKDL